jgi:hypothetical protein
LSDFVVVATVVAPLEAAVQVALIVVPSDFTLTDWLDVSVKVVPEM